MVKVDFIRGTTVGISNEPVIDGQILFDTDKKNILMDVKEKNGVERLDFNSLPSGGEAGQILRKASSVNHDVEWATVPGVGSEVNITASAVVDSTVGSPSVSVQKNETSDGQHFTFSFSGLKGENSNIPDVTASVDSNTGTPHVEVIDTGTAENPSLEFAFSNLKGEKGEQGLQGPQGAIGPQGPRGADGTVSFNDLSPSQRESLVGNGITSIEKTSSSGVVDTYTISYTKKGPDTFTITNGGISNIDELDDVTIETPSNGDMLIYNSTTEKWVNDHNTKMNTNGSNAESEVEFSGAFTVGSRKENSEIGTNSFANGMNVEASGDYSHAEGETYSGFFPDPNDPTHYIYGTRYLVASGEASHAEGQGTSSTGVASHSEGIDSSASGNHSHAEGNNCVAAGESSHAEGSSTSVWVDMSRSVVYKSIASGKSSHSEGSGTTATGEQSHAEGYLTRASGVSSHSEGIYTESSGVASHSSGRGGRISDVVDNTNVYASGSTISAFGTGSHVEGVANSDWYKCGIIQAQGIASHAEGAAYCDSYRQAHGSGHIIARGIGSHVEGYVKPTMDSETNVCAEFLAFGDGSHVEGCLNTNTSSKTIASGDGSHIEGINTNPEDVPERIASGNGSHLEGCASMASGDFSHAEGYNTVALGNASHVGGNGATAYRSNSFVQGGTNKFVGTNMQVSGDSVFGFQPSGNLYGTNTTIDDGQNGVSGTIANSATITINLATQGMYLLMTSTYTISTGAIYGAQTRMLVAHGLATGTPIATVAATSGQAQPAVTCVANNKITIKNVSANYVSQFALIRIL